MPTGPGWPAPSMNELEEERDFLLRSLTDLETERSAGDLDDADYVALRDGYTARAAAVLRELDDPTAGTPARGPAPHPPGRRRVRSLAGAGFAVAVAVGAGALMAGSSGQRLPGDPGSGSITATGPSADLQRARLLVQEGRTLDAIKVYDSVLAVDPDQPEALTYRGWFVFLAGRRAETPELVAELTGRGLAAIDRAIVADPTYPDPHFFRGLVMLEDRGDPAAAVAEMRAFLASGPPAQYVPKAEEVLRLGLAQLEGGAPPG